MTGGLRLHVDTRLGALHLRADLHVDRGEVVAVVGPNGAGKSTLLRVVAGLARPDRGRLDLGDRVLLDTDAGIDVPPAERRAGVVFQDLLLFDHLSTRANVAFGPRSRGTPRSDADALAREWLGRVGLADREDERPNRLSGGQRQRVALARALAADPAVLLLDEPLSALDADARGAVRRELRTHLAGFDGPALLVTHEPLEALALAHRLVVLEAGRVTQVGTPAEVARRPRSSWVARLVGVNLLAGTASHGHIAVDGGGQVVAADAVDGRVLATVHPRSVALHRERPAGSPRNVWVGEVADVEPVGEGVRATVTAAPPGLPALTAEVTAAAAAELHLAGGGPVWVSFKAAEVTAYPDDGPSGL